MPKHNNNNNNNNTPAWLESLVQQSSTANDTTILSKSDRIRKRKDKKAKREQRRHNIQQQQQDMRGMERPSNKEHSKIQPTVKRTPSELSKRRLHLIASSIDKVRQKVYGNTDIRPKLYDTKVAVRTMSTNTKKRKRSWSKDSIQPRPSDYSGIGLARNSLYIEFLDPACLAKLEEEFREHIPGFFGKQWSKAMKRQTNGDMLWRQLADNKHRLSKKLKSMNPDQRVQAMIDAGMI
jgi:hypothetical protein